MITILLFTVRKFNVNLNVIFKWKRAIFCAVIFQSYIGNFKFKKLLGQNKFYNINFLCKMSEKKWSGLCYIPLITHLFKKMEWTSQSLLKGSPFITYYVF